MAIETTDDESVRVAPARLQSSSANGSSWLDAAQKAWKNRRSAFRGGRTSRGGGRMAWKGGRMSARGGRDA
jgi:hypothetical protein